MINLRYHIVSLTAVFLALGIGVLLGGTYLDRYTLDQLDQSITNAEERIRVTDAENDRLRGELGDAEARNRALLDAGTTQLFGDQLTAVPVLVVAAEGTDETARRNLLRSLASSGADFRGTLTVTDRIALADDGTRAALADAFEMDDPSAPEVRSEIVDRFGDALARAATPVDDPTAPGSDDTATTVPAEPTTTVPGDPPATTDTVPPTTTETGTPTDGPDGGEPTSPEILGLLLEQGILAFEPPPTPSESGPLLSDTGYRYVFLTGPDPVVADDTFLVPTLRRMAEVGPVPTVMVSVSAPTPADGDDVDRGTALAGIRTDPELSRLVSTVDNLEYFNGIASTVLALDEIGRGARGHYGEGRGAAAPLPTGT
jgi:hypothetical protein